MSESRKSKPAAKKTRRSRRRRSAKRKSRVRSSSRGPAPSSAGRGEELAREKVRKLWQEGDLFHAGSRYPRKRDKPRVDRLAGILKSGLVAPAHCEDGSVFSDLNLVVTGLSFRYDSLVFLHRFGERSSIYTISSPGRFFVFVDPTFPVLTPKEMGKPWVELCRDEVYVRQSIPVERLLGVVIHPADAASVMAELLTEFQRAAIPLYDHSGKLLWPT